MLELYVPQEQQLCTGTLALVQSTAKCCAVALHMPIALIQTTTMQNVTGRIPLKLSNNLPVLAGIQLTELHREGSTQSLEYHALKPGPSSRGVPRGARETQCSGRWNAQKSHNNVASTFFNAVHLLPVGAKLISYSGRHLTMIRHCPPPLRTHQSTWWVAVVVTIFCSSCATNAHIHWQQDCTLGGPNVEHRVCGST